MRYRQLTPLGDSTFASGNTQFFINTAYGVAQACITRLKLSSGEWFLDTSEGTPYSTKILGKGTQPTYDLAIQERILNTEGVKSILTYASTLNTATRALTVNAVIDTIYGQATIQVTL